MGKIVNKIATGHQNGRSHEQTEYLAHTPSSDTGNAEYLRGESTARQCAAEGAVGAGDRRTGGVLQWGAIGWHWGWE